MKLIILIVSTILNLHSFELDEVRSNYNVFVSDKELCRETINVLKKLKDNSAIHLGYLGGLQTIWANHVMSPFTKLETFKAGKKNIELAIKSEPENVELRFIRLSVQKNAPSFLGYRSNIESDKNFILKNFKNINSEKLKILIRNSFKNVNMLTKEEYNFIN